jgi:uncharacterized protein YndB with AHSA1/START domain
MKILKVVGMVVASLVVLFLLGALVLPAQRHLERDVEIAAPPAVVYAYLMDLRKTPEWSAWVAMDPQTKQVFTGKAGEIGQSMTWDSTKLGTGLQTIVETKKNSVIRQELLFNGKDKAESSFLLAPTATGTKVTFTFDGAMAYPQGRWFGLLLEKFLGQAYEQGLASIKQHVEAK